MRLGDVTVVAYGKALEPEFLIDLNFLTENNAVVLWKVSGWIMVNDKKVAVLQEHDYNKGGVQEFYTIKIAQSIQKQHFQRTYTAPLSRLALEAIENSRTKNLKGDVELNIILNAEVLQPEFYEQSLPDVQRNNQNVLAVNYGILFKSRALSFERRCKIPSADWVHDFCPVFNLGTYRVLEIPYPVLISGKSQLSEKLKLAITALDTMHKELLDCEWSNVIKESRPVWELIRSKAEINELLKANGTPDRVVESFDSMINSLFDYSSKYIHKEDKDKKLMHATAEKEDANLIYSTAVNVVNLISKKMQRVES